MKYIKYPILITFLFIFNSCASLSLFSPETHNHYTNSNDSLNKNEPVVNKANTINLFKDFFNFFKKTEVLMKFLCFSEKLFQYLVYVFFLC